MFLAELDVDILTKFCNPLFPKDNP